MMLGGLQTARADLIARRIVLWQVHELMVANSLYENINMGAFNFTLSLWESFLRRAPTEAEHRDAMLAYDGQPQVLFGVQVRDRFELVNVFVQSQAYAEGMVRNAFLFYLYREPTQPEILKGLLAYNTNRNYLDVEAYVLASNDYSLR
jgi:hypothetical protein